jgi:hypothetical protein
LETETLAVEIRMGEWESRKWDLRKAEPGNKNLEIRPEEWGLGDEICEIEIGK